MIINELSIDYEKINKNKIILENITEYLRRIFSIISKAVVQVLGW